MSDIEKKLHEGIDAILGKGGLAERKNAKGGRFRVNPHQLDYAHRAASGFCRFDADSGKSSLNLLQAATGTGKTLAYLVPEMLYAAYTGKRVAVSTYTRHLQRQIIEKDAVNVQQWVEKITGVSLTVSRRLGKANYVSPVECELLIGALTSEDKTRHKGAIHFLSELLEWVEEEDKHEKRVNSGVLDDFMETRCIEVIPDGISRRAICLNTTSSDDEISSYREDVERSKSADVLIVNHALMMMNANRWSSLLDEPEGRRISVAVFDEADRLEDAAKAMLAADVSLHRLLQKTQKVGEVFGLESLRGACQQLHDFVMAQKIPSEGARVVSKEENLAKLITGALSVMLPVVKSWVPKAKDLLSDGVKTADRLMADFTDEVNDLVQISEAMLNTDNSAVLSWSPIKAYPSLRVGRPGQGRVLSRMWNVPKEKADDTLPPRGYVDAVLFTSATLTVPGKPIPDAFDDFSNSVGIVRYPAKGESTPIHNVQFDLMQKFQPGKFGKMTFVLADPRVNSPTIRTQDEEGFQTDPEWLDYCATVIRTAQQAGGRVLVLTLSWPDTLGLAKRLDGLEGLIVHKRGDPLRGVVAQYKATPNAVMLSPGAWEGVDLPGMVNQLVITRIPFLPPNRPEQDQERIHLISKGYDKKNADNVIRGKDAISTRKKLEQGLGRGIRSFDDNVTVWIADPRFPYPQDWPFDSVMAAAPVRANQASLLSCIPSRFLDTSYSFAQLCLSDGTLYRVIKDE